MLLLKFFHKLAPSSPITILVIRVLLDPISKVWNSSVNSGSVSIAAADAPTDDPRKLKSAVVALNDERPTRVAFARVLPAVGCPCAKENSRDPLVLPGRPIHRHALCVGDDGQVNLAKNRWYLTVLWLPSPSGDPTFFADEIWVGIGQANRDDVRLERKEINY